MFPSSMPSTGASDLLVEDGDSDVVLSSSLTTPLLRDETRKSRERDPSRGESDVRLLPESVRLQQRKLLEQRMYQECGDTKRAAEASIRNGNGENIQRYGM